MTFLPRLKMIKIRIVKTGEIKEETPNVAFDLIDRKVAVLASVPMSREELRMEERRKVVLQNTSKTEDRQENSQLYQNRQMRSSGGIQKVEEIKETDEEIS